MPVARHARRPAGRARCRACSCSDGCRSSAPSPTCVAVPVAGLVMLYGLPAACSPAPCRRSRGVVMLPVGCGRAVGRRGRRGRPRPRAAGRRGRGRRGRWSSLALVVVCRAGWPPGRPTGCDNDRADGRAPPDRRRRVDPARRGRPTLVHDARRRRRPVADGRRVRRRGRTSCAPSSTPPRPPPFLTERRVVVARDVGRFTADELAPARRLPRRPAADAPSSCSWGSERRPKALDRRAVEGGRRRSRRPTPPSRARDRQGVGRSEAAATRRAARLSGPPATLAEHLGEDVGALDGILRTLAATYGDGAPLRRRATSSRSSARPAACRRGTSPTPSTPATPARRSTLLARMIGAGERHPLQVMAILHSHYGKLAAPRRRRRAHARRRRPRRWASSPGSRRGRRWSSTAGSAATAVQRAIDLLAAGRPRPARRQGCSTTSVVMEVLVARLQPPAAR